MSENILDKFKDAPADEKVRDMSKKIKVGIIGTGWIFQDSVFRVRALAQLDRSDLR